MCLIIVPICQDSVASTSPTMPVSFDWWRLPSQGLWIISLRVSQKHPVELSVFWGGVGGFFHQHQRGCLKRWKTNTGKAKSSSIPKLACPGRCFIPAFAVWLSMPPAQWQQCLAGEPLPEVTSEAWDGFAHYRFAAARAELPQAPPRQRIAGTQTSRFGLPSEAGCAEGGAAMPVGWGVWLGTPALLGFG